jgi:alkylated DNA repair dioxygenase AlkB
VAPRNKAGNKENLPAGLLFFPEFLSETEERELIAFVERLNFGTLQMHGVTARRRIKQFGWHYAFESYQLTRAEEIPAAFDEIRARSAGLAGIAPEDWAEALVTEYRAGAGIGWHRDAPPFGTVAGISLKSACRMRFQIGSGADRRTSAIELPPRSMYLLTDEARLKWQHMIPPARELRYSITFRTIRKRKNM